jgi:hypothetical protein
MFTEVAMKTRTAIYILMLSIYFIVMTGCAAKESITVYEEPHLGNTAGNIKNGGFAASCENRIYFANPSDRWSIWSMYPDGSDMQKLNNHFSSFINVMDGWIYYLNEDDSKIQIMRTDGSSKRVLSAFDKYYRQSIRLIVVGERIFFDVIGGKSEDSGLFFMDTSGSDIQRLRLDNETINIFEKRNVFSAFHMSVNYLFNDWNFDMKNIYSTDTDDSGDINEISGYSPRFVVLNDRIFFNYFEYGIFSINLDGSDVQKLGDDIIHAINVKSDRVFYINTGHSPTKGDGKLYSIDFNGNNRKALSDYSISAFNIHADRIYYMVQDKSMFGLYNLERLTAFSLYSMNLDGSDKRFVA